MSDSGANMGMGYYIRLNDQCEFDVLIGITDHEWPVQLFESEAHAKYWIKTPATRLGNARAVKRLYRAKVVIGEELSLIEPEPYLTNGAPS